MGMNQLVEKNLSPPRGLVCCSSRTKALAWNINIQLPCIFIHIGVGVELGSALVPELAWWIICWANVLLSRFIKSPMPDLSGMGMDIWDIGCWATAAMLHSSSVTYKMRFTKTPQKEQTKICNGIFVPPLSVRGVELSNAQRWDE